MLKPQPYELINTIQHYDWGTKGKNAFIPKLLNIKAENDKPYTELWMGAHPKATSKIIVGGKEIDLAEVIRQYPMEMLGRKTAKRFSNTLPFLFKVLSANEALSIQAHPSKRQAIALRKKDPVNYPDPYHKLEIAIALDSLTALVGFKSYYQLNKTLKAYPEILDLCSQESIENYLKPPFDRIVPESQSKMLKQVQHDDKKSVRRIFTHLIETSSTNKEGLKDTIQKLSKRISEKKKQTEIEKYFVKLHKKYNVDIGLLILFFLNLVHLKRGEAIFTKPGIPHAYLEGNILECMSNSDNVIRAGLTPKFKDVNTLLKVLNYELTAPKILKGQKKGNSIIYKTDAKEFEIEIFTSSKNELKFENQVGPRILLVLEGAIKFLFMDGVKTKSEKILKGESVFLPSVLLNFKIASEKTSRFVLVTVP